MIAVKLLFFLTVQNVDTKAERDSPKPEETTSEETTEENENKDTEETPTTNDEEPAENDWWDGHRSSY